MQILDIAQGESEVFLNVVGSRLADDAVGRYARRLVVVPLQLDIAFAVEVQVEENLVSFFIPDIILLQANEQNPHRFWYRLRRGRSEVDGVLLLWSQRRRYRHGLGGHGERALAHLVHRDGDIVGRIAAREVIVAYLCVVIEAHRHLLAFLCLGDAVVAVFGVEHHMGARERIGFNICHRQREGFALASGIVEQVGDQVGLAVGQRAGVRFAVHSQRLAFRHDDIGMRAREYADFSERILCDAGHGVGERDVHGAKEGLLPTDGRELGAVAQVDGGLGVCAESLATDALKLAALGGRDADAILRVLCDGTKRISPDARQTGREDNVCGEAGEIFESTISDGLHAIADGQRGDV